MSSKQFVCFLNNTKKSYKSSNFIYLNCILGPLYHVLYKLYNNNDNSLSDSVRK